jgi:hypothetical protein
VVDNRVAVEQVVVAAAQLTLTLVLLLLPEADWDKQVLLPVLLLEQAVAVVEQVVAAVDNQQLVVLQGL